MSELVHRRKRKPYLGKPQGVFAINAKRTTLKTERLKKILLFMIENPEKNKEEVAAAFDISYSTLANYLRDSSLLRHLRGMASKRVLGMIPLAVQGFEDSLRSGNDKIKYFASKDLLQSEHILGAERVDVTITDNSSRTLEELQEAINQAKQVPLVTIDAELIE